MFGMIERAWRTVLSRLSTPALGPRRTTEDHGGPEIGEELGNRFPRATGPTMTDMTDDLESFWSAARTFTARQLAEALPDDECGDCPAWVEDYGKEDHPHGLGDLSHEWRDTRYERAAAIIRTLLEEMG